MKLRAVLQVSVAVAGIVFLAGCEDTVSSKQAKAHAPAATPTPDVAALHESLPFPQQPIHVAVLYDTRPAIDVLVDQVQVRFDAAEKEYKAGEFDKARKDYDDAVKLIVSSGFQADSDPRLSDLFDQIGETLHSYEVNAEQGADDDEVNPSAPAPIDELSDMTLPPGDPRLAGAAEEELMRVRHDLPLTVNDSVLQYLSFFSTTRGHAVVEHGLDRSGRYNDMIRRVLKKKACRRI